MNNIISINILHSSLSLYAERFDDRVTVLDSMDRQFPDQLRVRSLHPEEHRDDTNVAEDLQHDRPVDASDRADRTGLHKTGPAGISYQHPRHSCVQQYRRFLRSQR